MTSRILLVDDHHVVELGLRAIIASRPGLVVVGAVATGEEAVDWVGRDPPEMVVLDLRLAGEIDGIEAARRIAAIAPGVRTLCYTAADEEPYATRFLQAGGKAFVTKNSRPSEVLMAIERVLAGGRYLEPRMAQKIAVNRCDGRGDGCCFDRLSPRESEIVRRILLGQKNAAICAALRIMPSTLSTHRSRIFAKLGVRTDAELVLLARRCGVLDAVAAGPRRAAR
jgi:DNA-binding NarL/FixJ family response regulator